MTQTLVRCGDIGRIHDAPEPESVEVRTRRRISPLDGFVEVPRDEAVRRWDWWVTVFWLSYAAAWVCGLTLIVRAIR